MLEKLQCHTRMQLGAIINSLETDYKYTLDGIYREVKGTRLTLQFKRIWGSKLEFELHLVSVQHLVSTFGVQNNVVLRMQKIRIAAISQVGLLLVNGT